MKEGVIFVQKAYYLSTSHLARSRTPTDLYKRVYARTRAFVCTNIPRVSIEVQMGIFTGENNQIILFYREIRASFKNKGFPQK